LLIWAWPAKANKTSSVAIESLFMLIFVSFLNDKLKQL
jgi:hypothetical protein